MPCLVVCAYTHQEVHPLALLSFPKEGKFALQRSKPKRKGHKRDFFLLSLFVFVQLKIVPFALLKGREKRSSWCWNLISYIIIIFGKEKIWNIPKEINVSLCKKNCKLFPPKVLTSSTIKEVNISPLRLQQNLVKCAKLKNFSLKVQNYDNPWRPISFMFLEGLNHIKLACTICEKCKGFSYDNFFEV